MIWLVIIFYLAVVTAIAGLIYLKAGEDNRSFYGHIFHWYISPLVIFAGLIFLDRSRRPKYFRNLKSNLFIK